MATKAPNSACPCSTVVAAHGHEWNRARVKHGILCCYSAGLQGRARRRLAEAGQHVRCDRLQAITGQMNVLASFGQTATYGGNGGPRRCPTRSPRAAELGTATSATRFVPMALFVSRTGNHRFESTRLPYVNVDPT